MYDFNIVFVFQQSQGNDYEVLGMIKYVDILKEILQLEYGIVPSPIVLFPYKGVKNGNDNKGNPTYKQDDVGFMLVNFWHFLHAFDGPFCVSFACLASIFLE
jgi:hypothetical protein